MAMVTFAARSERSRADLTINETNVHFMQARPLCLREPMLSAAALAACPWT